MARSFVLVGDHYQLPPLVASPAALAGGYGESLFRRLSEAHPQAIVTLRRQYRMAADIMALSNELVYNGTLLCGSESVARSRLHLTHWCATGAAAGAHTPPMPTWIKQALDPERRVVFLDTSGVVSCMEQEEDGVVSNPGEAGLVGQLVQYILECGAQEEDIGLVSPYRAQVSLLEKAVHAKKPPCSTTSRTAAAAAAGAAGGAGAAAQSANSAVNEGLQVGSSLMDGIGEGGGKVSAPTHIAAAAAAAGPAPHSRGTSRSSSVLHAAAAQARSGAAAQAGPAAPPNAAPGALQGSSTSAIPGKGKNTKESKRKGKASQGTIPGLLQLRLPSMALTQAAAASKLPALKATQPLATAQAPEQHGHQGCTATRASQPSEEHGPGEVLEAAGGGVMDGDVGAGRPGEGCTAPRPPIEVLTIDKYQGRDKPCIVLSFVRSNTKGSAGRLLADWQRLNVALTRAKHKLVMVGCAATLQEIPLLSSMLQMVEKNGWRLPLSEALASS
ncbi:AAA domain-containing protein [Dunaliella salina]|uniref:AAA domain-containing protein n=1 Tax=Dunaliella salina TaxID=3046 RepID=A0ABQ7FUY9_DUNSA|nr:AAA domain-containing protein [Dunaliella salina]|eukprot:KAF5826217.1 AAA domain-containing protein [Dunaliella salina]